MEESTINNTAGLPLNANLETSTLVDFESLIKSVKGRLCQKHDEPHLSWTFCKPKLLPLKTFTVEKLEKLQKEAEEKLQRSDVNSAD